MKMKKLLTAAALVAAFSSFTANADPFNFTYTFNDSAVVTGELNGTLNGSLLENITDVRLFVNGERFTGNIFASAWNDATQSWDDSMPAAMSTDALQNNFIFADASAATDLADVTRWFSFTNMAGVGPLAVSANGITGETHIDGPELGNWSLTRDTSVPTPPELLLLLSGLGMMAAMRFRASA
jgi:hypothetical protein